MKKKVDDTVPTKIFKKTGWFVPSLWQMVDWGDFDPGLTFAQNVALYYRARCGADMDQYGCLDIAQYYDHWSGLSGIPENPCGIMTLCDSVPWLLAGLTAGSLDDLSSAALAENSEESVVGQALECGDLCGGISTERELQMGRMLGDAAQSKGFSGIGSGTQEEAEIMGRAWVGPNYSVRGDGKVLVSQDGLRQFRFPSYKPNRPMQYGGPGYQANFEWRVKPSGAFQADAHLDITDMR